MEHYIGIDIGGTFTDCAVLDGEGRIVATAKAPSTRDDPAQGVIDAIRAAAESLETDPGGLLSGCRHLIHGCTIATNAVVERSGVATGLIATKGHEDAIPIGKVMQKVAGQSEREMIHQSHLDKADPPIVDRRMIRGVSERLDRAGDVVVAMDEDEAARAVDALVADGARAIAVCFLWSFLNGEHERRVRERIAKAHPGIYVTVSSELAPVLGEYERAVTTVLNAYVGPKVVDYLERLSSHLREAGYRAPLLLAHSMGGLTTMEDVRARPLLMLDSGPVSGVLGARFFGAAYGEDNILCADMGGTTFDVAMIEGGRSVLDEQPVIDKYAYLMPKVAVSSVGAGGGSIVWLDENGLLRVGPDSAGADPGPACYGRGGARLTVTDVDLILGFLDASAFLGGRMRLDIAAAQAAADRIAAAMGTDRTGVASGAFRIVNAHMADLMRRCSIDRGRDPRDFVLFAYGGAAAMHIAYLARELRIGTVYVPSFASVFSALGMMTGGLLHSEEASFPAAFPLADEDWRRLGNLFEAREGSLARLFESEGVPEGERRFERSLYMKYRLQPSALSVPVSAAASQHAVVDAFEARYSALYGANAAYRAAGIEIVKCRVEGSAETVAPALAAVDPDPDADPEAARSGTRPIFFPELGTARDTPVYDGARLVAGMQFAGPLVIERTGDTIVLPSFAGARVDEFGNVVIAVDPPGDTEGTMS